MKEILELNSRLMAAAGTRFASADTVLFIRRNEIEDIIKLPPPLQTELEALRTEIHRVLPNDFNYTICLGDEEPNFSVEYEDGPQTEFFKSGPWVATRSLIEQLSAMDWDAERAEAISESQAFEVMKTEAALRPSRLPSTKELQKHFRDEMHDFVKTKRKDATKTHVMTFQDMGGVECQTFDSLHAFAADLYNIMTVKMLVITVVTDGKPLPIEKIDRLKKDALSELESMPISHAKATFRM